MGFGIGTRVRRAIRRVAGTDEWICSALTLPLGQISLGESRALGALVAGLTEPGPIVEVGTLFGWSTRVMVLFKDPTRELITVDSYVWNPLLLPAEQHARATGAALQDAVDRHGVRVVTQDKAAFYETYTGPAPSLVFLDAIHSYEETRKDIEWARRVRAKTICLHDYSPKHPGVVQAVDEAGGPRQLFESLAVL
jgi:hypothetical protein